MFDGSLLKWRDREKPAGTEENKEKNEKRGMQEG